MRGDEAGQRVGVQALVVAGHGDHPRARQGEALQRREVGRVLDEDRVAAVEQDGRDEPERLLGAGRDEQLVRAAPAGRAGRSARRAARAAAGRPRSRSTAARGRRPSAPGRSAKAPAMSSVGKSSGAGRPPAKEMTSSRCVSSRMSRTGEERTSASWAESGGKGCVIQGNHRWWARGHGFGWHPCAATVLCMGSAAAREILCFECAHAVRVSRISRIVLRSEQSAAARSHSICQCSPSPISAYLAWWPMRSRRAESRTPSPSSRSSSPTCWPAMTSSPSPPRARARRSPSPSRWSSASRRPTVAPAP